MNYKDILDAELYQVETDSEGVKRVHIDGYFYAHDNEFSLCQYTFLYLDIDNNLRYRETIDDAEEESKMYQYDGYSYEAMMYEFEHYFNGHKPESLPLSEVTKDTPDGYYISVRKKNIADLYDMAAAYIGGAGEYTSHEIIETACEVLRGIENGEVEKLWSRISAHLNMWNENTLDEQIADGDELIEEISGTLGEQYFGD